MKKIVVFFVLLALVFTTGLVFAGGGAQRRGAANEVVIFMTEGSIRDDIQPVLFRDFEQSTGYRVNVINGGADSVYRQNLAVALSGGQPVDILMCNGQAVRPFLMRGLIEDLTDRVTYWDRFIPSAIELATFGGRRYGVPYGHVTTSGIYTNNDVLRRYNLSLPRTYDDLLAMRDVLARDNISVFAFGGGSKYMWPMWFFCTFAQTSGNRSMERTEATLRGQARWTDRDYVEAMEILGRMGRDGFFQPGFNGTESDPAKSVFLTGNAALFFGGTWELQPFRDSGMAGDRMSMAGFPIVAPGARSEQTGAAGSPTLCLHSGASADRQRIALELIDFISSDAKVQQHRDIAGTSFPDVNRGYRLPADTDPIVTNAVVPTLGPSTVTFLDWIWPAEIVAAFQDQIQIITSGRTTAVEAMAAIQRVYDDLVRDGYRFDD